MPQIQLTNEAERKQAIQLYMQLKEYQWKCNTPYCNGLPHPGIPRNHARYSQLLGNDPVVAMIAGRGAGKTRAGAQQVAERMMSTPKHGVLIMAESKIRAKQICMKGPSGLLSVLPPYAQPQYNATEGFLTLANGSWAQVFGCNNAADAETPRGFESSTVWCEELGTWRYQRLAWDMLQMANRSMLGGITPQTIITATPRPTPVIKMILKWSEDGRCKLVRGSTFDNVANLAPTYIEMLRRQYEDSALGRQELYGEMVEDATGALWSSSRIEDSRVLEHPVLQRIVIGVDPSGGGASEAGIVVVGVANGQAYVLEDASGMMSSDEWPQVVVQKYYEYQADAVIGETNFGGDQVESLVRAVDSSVNFKEIHASRGKMRRAEPVAVLFKDKKAHLVGNFGLLESQMTTWIPPGQMEMDVDGIPVPISPSNYSPDRMDAMVWGVTHLMLAPKKARTVARFH